MWISFARQIHRKPSIKLNISLYTRIVQTAIYFMRTVNDIYKQSCHINVRRRTEWQICNKLGMIQVIISNTYEVLRLNFSGL